MNNIIKVAFLSSVITAAMVYVLLEWQPLRPESSRPPGVSEAYSPASTSSAPALTAEPVAPPAAVSDDERNNIEIYQRYSPGVVNITTVTLTRDFFFQAIPQSGSGSGAIIDNAGHIVTNYHVIENAQRLEVTLSDKTKHPASVVGADPSNDLAVIKIDTRQRLTPVPLGTSQGLQVGQKVLAIGNPFALQGTLTTGIISSLGRSIEATNGRVIEEVIQTDAAINPGNSGGPLLNSSGQIIGINTAIYSRSGGSVGIGFAVPVDTVKRITTDLVTYGYVRRPYLGVSSNAIIPLQDIPGLARALRLQSGDEGLLVVDVVEDSPADEAGIRGSSGYQVIGNYRVPAGGDVILAFDGRPVNNFQELASQIDRRKIGDTARLTILRNNQKLDIDIVLQETPRTNSRIR
jgi:putative serine protease PepD